MQKFEITSYDHLRKAITREGHVVVIQKREKSDDYLGSPTYYPYKYVHPVTGTIQIITSAGAIKVATTSILDVQEWTEELVTEHTRGPWSVCTPSRDDQEYLFGIEGPGECSYIICDVCGDGYPTRVQEANARLIAAAPELFELTKRVINLNPFGDREIYEAKLTATELINKVEGK